jgi:cytidine deaminase
MDGEALVARAGETRERAYAPYSHYLVGAAVLTEDGSVFTGCNVENASYGLTVCAERVAVFSAVAAGHKRITAVAILTPSRGAPCGACRQVLLEFGGGELEVHLADPEGGRRKRTLADLLPEAFGPDDLRAAEG